MFNAARTFLANQAPANGYPYLAEELTPPTFRPLKLPGYLQTVRTLLFGSNPDREFVNYRCRQFLTLIHATPLVSFVYALDRRITYRTGDSNDLLSDSDFQPTVNQFAGPGTTATVIGQAAAPDASGRMRFSYMVQLLTDATAQVSRTVPPPSQDPVESFTMTDSISSPIDLAGSGYQLVLANNPIGAGWLVEGRLRPEWDLGAIAATAVASLSAEVTSQLFGLAVVEPYQTFNNLWTQGPDLPSQLAGLLLAVIYRTAALSS